MNYVRQHAGEVVARSRPELDIGAQERLIDQIVELIQTYAPDAEREPLKMLAVGESHDFFSHRAPPKHNGLQLGSNEIAFLAVCDLSGTVSKVIRDAIGLGARFTPGADLTGIVSPFHTRRAAGFLRTTRRTHTSYDYALSVVARSGMVRPFWSGFVVGSQMVVIGTVRPLAASIPAELGELTQKEPQALTPVLKQLAHWKRENTNPSHASTFDEPSDAAAEAPSTIEVDHRALAAPRRLLELAAHDLRNPISGVLAACQYLMEDATRLLEPHQILVLASIESSARLALQLIQNMGEIPSIRIGKIELEMHPTDIVSVLQQTVSALRPLAEVMKVKMVVRVNEHVPKFSADPVKLDEALQGLLVNALGTDPVGGELEVTVSAGSDEATIAVRREYHDDSHTHRPPTGRKSARETSPRKLSDIHAALLWVRAKRIFKAHGGTVRAENHGKQRQSWTAVLPIVVSQPARRS